MRFLHISQGLDLDHPSCEDIGELVQIVSGLLFILFPMRRYERPVSTVAPLGSSKCLSPKFSRRCNNLGEALIDDANTPKS